MRGIYNPAAGVKVLVSAHVSEPCQRIVNFPRRAHHLPELNPEPATSKGQEGKDEGVADDRSGVMSSPFRSNSTPKVLQLVRL